MLVSNEIMENICKFISGYTKCSEEYLKKLEKFLNKFIEDNTLYFPKEKWNAKGLSPTQSLHWNTIEVPHNFWKKYNSRKILDSKNV